MAHMRRDSELTFKISNEKVDALSIHLLAAIIPAPLRARCHATLGRVVAGFEATRKMRHIVDEKTACIVGHDPGKGAIDSASGTMQDAALMQASA